MTTHIHRPLAFPFFPFVVSSSSFSLNIRRLVFTTHSSKRDPARIFLSQLYQMRTSNAKKQLRSATTGMERGKFICQGLLLRPAPLVFFAESVRYFSVVLGVFLSPLYISLLVSGSRAVMKKQNSESPFL